MPQERPSVVGELFCSRDRKANFVAWPLFSHNLPIDRARQLFKPSEEAESLPGLIETNSGTFGKLL